MLKKVLYSRYFLPDFPESEFIIYYVSTEKEFEKIFPKENIVMINPFVHRGNTYIIFYVKKDTELTKKINATAFSYKDKDVMLNKHGGSKNELKKYITREAAERNSMLGNFSSLDRMELHANKIQYIQFFSDLGIISGKEVITNKKFHFKDYPNKVVKFPYSDTTTCVFYKGKNIRNKKNVQPRDCFSNEGFIVEKFNYSDGEIKAMTLYGEIVYMIYYAKNYKKYIIDKNFKCDDKIIEKLVRPFKKEIQEFVRKIYISVNLLIEVKRRKIAEEMRLYEMLDIPEQKRDEDVMTSLFYNTKMKHLLPYKTSPHYPQLIQLVKQSFYEFYDENPFSSFPISDPYNRVDMKFPDGRNYHEIMLVEIDSYSGGKAKGDVLKHRISKGVKWNSFFLTEIMKNQYEEYREKAKKNILNTSSSSLPK